MRALQSAKPDKNGGNGYNVTKSDKMDEMLIGRGNIPKGDIGGLIERFCERKWNRDFSAEMSRSCQAIVDSWYN